MRTRHFLALAALAAGAATALAAQAGAQSAVDQAFLNEVRNKGVPIESDAQALDLAHSTCGVLRNGGSTEAGLSHIASATHWSADQAANFGSLAVVAYCKDLMPQATAPQTTAPPAAAPQEKPKVEGPRLNVTQKPEEPDPLPIPRPEPLPWGERFGGLSPSAPYS